MSYKEKPQLKLYSYSNNEFILQAIIDDYAEVSFEHNLYQAGVFTISINYNIPNSQLFQRGLFIQFGNDPYDFGEIYTIQDAIGEDGKGSQIRTITGYDARYILKRRVIKNMNSNGLWVMTAKGELCLRNLIKDQCGSGAESKRQLPITNVIPGSAAAIGKEYSVSEQFTNLYEVCKTIATQSEIGWRIKFDGSLTLECYEGENKSDTVRFDTNYESLANGNFSDSSESFSNAVYVGGKGQNDSRDIYEGENGTPSGFDRFEAWDNQSSMTVESEYEAEAVSMLTQYGQTIQMAGNGLAKCPYIYKEQYNVGDWITVAFSGKSAVVQILSVTEHWAWGSYNIQFSFGKPQNNLAEQLQLMLRKIQSASNKENATDSVRWYTIPTNTSMPKEDVTYNTIGFTGACASGGSTFTIYIDNEKTGSKNYNVYFKNLSGGKLTLTTGKAGATNIVMNSGTYTASIYIDENGNITLTSATPSNTVSSGNMNPVTSNAVASAVGGYRDIFSISTSAANITYYKISGLVRDMWAKGSVFHLQTRDGELVVLSFSSNDNNIAYPMATRIVDRHKKIVGLKYSETTKDIYVALGLWSNFLSLTQISGNYYGDIQVSPSNYTEYSTNTADIPFKAILGVDMGVNSKLKRYSMYHDYINSDLANYGYLQLPIPTDIASENIIAVNVYSGNISASQGLQILPLYAGNGVFYFNYYKPAQLTEAIRIFFVFTYLTE